MTTPFELRTRSTVTFGDGALSRIGGIAKDLGFTRSLLVADTGVVSAGLSDCAAHALQDTGIGVVLFSEFHSNPDTEMVEAGAHFAAAERIDSIIGLGGGSSMDCAKGINFVLTQGGRMADYRGFGKAARPMLPSIGVPTTAGTGSEAQSYAIISDRNTHEKLACGDQKAAFGAVILDPGLTRSQPRAVTATAGFDAIAHAVETYVTTKRNSFSEMLSRESWRLLEGNYENVLTSPDALDSRSAMQLGAYYAGMAIELSMLGATHACANPLTARYGTPHGVAIAVMLPHVVRWNAAVARSRYAELLESIGQPALNHEPGEALARRLEDLAALAELPRTLRMLGAGQDDLPVLAREAAAQWTGRFNPRPFDADAALEIYQCAW